MCSALGINPSIPILLHHFDVRPLPKRGWVSLTSIKDRSLFRLYSDLFKNFKDQYFKVIIRKAGRSKFHDEVEHPLFPFYWMRDPQKIKAYSVIHLNPTNLEAVRIITSCPRRLSARGLVECLGHEDSDQMAFGTISIPAPRKSNFMYLRKGTSGSPSTNKAPRPTPPPVKVTFPRRSCRPSSGAEVAGPVKTGQPQPIPIIFLEPSSEAVTPWSSPWRGRENPTRRETSPPPRRTGRKGAPPRPFLGRFFSIEFNVSHKTNFHMSSLQQTLVEPLFEGEVTNAMLELSTRASMLA